MGTYMKNKKTLSILAVLVLTIAVVYLFVILSKHELSPKGTVLTEKTMKEDFLLLGGEDLKVEFSLAYPNGFTTEYTVKPDDGSINKKAQIIGITASNRSLGDISKPYDVILAMRTWLYLKDRTPPYDIIGVQGVFTRKWIMSKLEKAEVTKMDFERIYKKVYSPSMSEDELVSRMSEEWISLTHHDKWWDN